ncbi:hypothetical protein ACT3UQ_08945 [Glutamicibacter sp. AOP12-B1-11]|uniref:hypothetical protein n=1 Tax=Glutamicibacter sp. AOP12-B1-11 TaxID=3457725 RepID=UPI004033C15C
MTNQPPLNPDAIEVTERWMKEKSATFGLHWKNAKPIIETYLANAQPVLNGVEELDALPFNTVAMFTMRPLDRPVPFELSSINGTDKTWQQPGDGAAYPNSIMARYLPAIVLHRPEAKP